MTIKQVKKELENKKGRSAWERGVIVYAMELLDGLYYLDENEDLNARTLEKTLLNGASDWGAFSWGCCSLIYNEDICKRLSNATEQKQTKNGQLDPNKHEQWLDTQARALYQAYKLIMEIMEG